MINVAEIKERGMKDKKETTAGDERMMMIANHRRRKIREDGEESAKRVGVNVTQTPAGSHLNLLKKPFYSTHYSPLFSKTRVSNARHGGHLWPSERF